ncbi:hypothetical protein DNL40_05725 [Xylanimonas oleitrophica]|uniref:Metallophosphoesterase n=2 Tax=Xylanimonas oleitrophica TaxID=2607479 RepID=A0A2W5WZP4_9MICO|nr:hypothetical protein DNL40_05725 [Xylanimonas oleitrophica]
MTPLIRDVALRAEVDVILNAGDTTMNGTAVERVCVDSFATVRPDGVPMVVADGNHDSMLVSDAERARGQTVLDGSVVEVAGVRILGDRDPHETRVGVGTTAIADEDTADVGRRLTEVACEAGDVDLLLVHTPEMGNAPLHSGCVPFQVSGHTHTRYEPFPLGRGIRYVSGSTAGAASGQPTVGPLRGTAEMTLLRFDPAERRFTQWKLLEVRPDGSAAVSAWRDVPRPAVVRAAQDTEGADGTGADGEEEPNGAGAPDGDGVPDGAGLPEGEQVPDGGGAGEDADGGAVGGEEPPASP